MAGQQPRGQQQQRAQGKVTTSTPATPDKKPEAPKINTLLPVPVKDMRQLLVQIEPELRAAIPRTVNLDAGRLARLFLTAFQETPDLQKCTGRSLLSAVVQAAALGLECDGVLGHAYLIPFKNSRTNQLECKLLIGYRGFIVLAMRTEQVSFVYASVVHEGDHYVWKEVDGATGLPYLEHTPLRPGEHIRADGAIARGIVAAYAIVKMRDGSVKPCWLWKEEVDAIRARSRAGQSGPWVSDFEAMSAKSAIRKLCKTLGLSTELTRAAVADEQVELNIADVPLVEYELSPALAEAATSQRREELKEQYGAGGDAGGAAGTEGQPQQGSSVPAADTNPTSSDGDPNAEKGGELFKGRQPGEDG